MLGLLQTAEQLQKENVQQHLIPHKVKLLAASLLVIALFPDYYS